MDNLKKLSVVLWKNMLFRRRQFIMTSFEIILPTLFSIILVVLRTGSGDSWSSKYIDDFTIYSTYDVADNYYGRCKVLYSPDYNSTVDLLHYVNQTSPYAEFIGFKDEKDMEYWYSNTNNSKGCASGIVFTDYPSDGLLPKSNLHYKIRTADFSWDTNLLAPQIPQPGPLDKSSGPFGYNLRYRDSGFLYLQHLIALRFIETTAGEEGLLKKTKFMTDQQFTYPPYYEDNSYSNMLQQILPLFIVLSYIFISPTLIKYIIREKELGVKELMKLMGLPGWIQWCGWFASSFILMTISAIIIVALLCIKFKSFAVLGYSRPELLFIIFLFYIASSIVFCFFISTFFSKPTLGTALGTLAWLLTFFVPYYTLNPNYQNLRLSEKMAVSIFPNMAMSWAVRFIISFEGQQIGLQWSNMNQPSYPGDNMTLLHVFFMFIINIIVYSILTWYMDNVFPGVFGVNKPWYFPFTKTYWCGSIPNDNIPKSAVEERVENFENEPNGLQPTIMIQDLSKCYGWNNDGKLAVNNLNLNIFEGQITALLGHNGAGKTTTMSMLTGMFPPTNGTAYINGYDIRKDIDKAREDLGLCPQHNMLFNNLTVWEHLMFFGKLKKMSTKLLINEITQLLHKLQLWDKKDTFSMALSGGMKRKLNLGIALIGKPKILMLDEPTSGMDPEARRAIWDLLQEIRPGRCIVLTTHFMEEADVLGDRIAIMAQGQVECCGSPLFLKKRYGAGYHLNISKSGSCNVEAIVSLVQTYLEGAYVTNNSNVDLCVILPTEDTDQFPAMFAELENNLENLGINNFGVSVTSMEEVFLKVGETYEIVDDKSEMPDSSSCADLVDQENGLEPRLLTKNTLWKLWFEQIIGLLLKRWYYSRRRWTLLISQVLLPVLMVTIVLLLNNRLNNITTDNPPLVMDISQYGRTKVFFKDSSDFHQEYNKIFPDGTSFKDLGTESAESFLETLGKDDYVSYAKDYMVGAEFQVNKSVFRANFWFNGLYYHTEPLTLNLAHNAMAKYYTKNITSPDVSVVVENYPFPKARDNGNNIDVMTTIKAIMMGMFIPVGLSFLSSSFVVFPIHERASKSKHLQMMTGVGGLLFWGTSFLWDFACHFICSCIMLIIFATVDDTGAFSGAGKSEIVILLLVLYGWTAIPFTYLASFIFKLPATGFTRLTIINMVAGHVMSTFIFTFNMAGGSLWNVGKILQWFFRILPNFGVTIGFMNMVQVTAIKEQCKKMRGYISPKIDCDVEYLQWEPPGIGQDVFMLCLTGFLYFVLLALIEHGVFYGLWYSMCRCLKGSRQRITMFDNEMSVNGILDNDVVTEQERVRMMVSQGTQNEDVLVVHDLSKQFWNFKAVDHLNFAVKNAECFGLLGVNGAGKTTTFQMLTGVLVMTSGNAFTKGIDLKGDRPNFLGRIGYCPQFDALIDYLTGREMLTLYAYLRGIPTDQIKYIVDIFVKKFDLREHADKITVTYSGGNKRKLSAAIAFIGDPPLVFLDEPTTGVDPVARRKIWDILTSATHSGMSVVLTSHSMEECEVLCSRIAIMVNGQFQCLGGNQYLKNKFSQGFNIQAKLKRLGDGQEEAKVQMEFQNFIQHEFPSASVKDIHQGLVQYQVSDVNTKWTHLFATMEEAKRRFNLEDYSISQATLEQVFLSFARKQRVCVLNP